MLIGTGTYEDKVRVESENDSQSEAATLTFSNPNFNILDSDHEQDRPILQRPNLLSLTGTLQGFGLRLCVQPRRPPVLYR